MKVLFISSGNRVGITPIIKNQGESLKQASIELDYYCFMEKDFGAIGKMYFRCETI